MSEIDKEIDKAIKKHGLFTVAVMVSIPWITFALLVFCAVMLTLGINP